MSQREVQLESITAEALAALEQAKDAAAVEAVRVLYLGRQGKLTEQFSALKDPALAPEEKGKLGKQLNTAKQRLEEALAARRANLSGSATGKSSGIDATLPGYPPSIGRSHPISQVIDRILNSFRAQGFSVVQGPEIEVERNNFDALNIPPDHPSREGFDTFYLGDHGKRTGHLLRSHTSPVQIRFMDTHKPPLRIVVPGRVYRPDAVDATHCFQFHQVEGLAVCPGLTFGDLKGTLIAWARGMFGGKARLRFRPHYFPFTEPSAEADLSCIFCDGKGCRVCGQKGWLEILGCGMVHPEVFKAVNYLPGTTGFAFGMGVERIAMLLHGIEDIRYFYENDARFLQQFPGGIR